MRDFVMVSDSVTMGHPDKLCDRICDAVVDAWLASGQRAGVNAECAIASGVAFLSIRSGGQDPVDAAALARRVVEEAGYDPEEGHATMTVILDLAHDPALSPKQISAGIANHMVTSFGYATQALPSAMPAAIDAAHLITLALDVARADGRLGWIRPDAKAQVAVRYADRKPLAVQAVAISLGTVDEIGRSTLEAVLRAEIIDPALKALGLELAEDAQIGVAATETPAGPHAHTGLTGRKTSDDGYGAFVRQSGSALSGKDPSRIDRIADYAGRHAALGIVGAGLAQEAEVQLSYIPGRSDAYDIEVDTYGTGSIPDARILDRLTEVVDLRVAAIAERFNLWDLPSLHDGRFYQNIASHGQIGRSDLDLPWDSRDLANVLA